MMENIGSLLIQNNLTAIIEVIVFPILFIICLRRISHSCKQLIANRYGLRGQIFFGWFGVVIHEFSHLIVALLFGHKITGFRLLHVPNGDGDNKLGYVNHSYNAKSSYQRTGNLFIGIAPIFGCAIALIIATSLLTPSLLQQMHALPNFQMDWQIFKLDRIWKLPVLIIIAGNISIGGFDLSDADLTHIKFGLIIIIGLIIVATSFATLLGVGSIYINWLHLFSTTVNGILFFSLVVVLISNGVIRLITNY
ncbi:hypothetical protein [Nicoliella lavandulae]|uniref:Integral membrane protein n=1 Tax=Nicoliella lavandulae TaxID=3082954 RepID=A0ABU8SJI3_9LACO